MKEKKINAIGKLEGQVIKKALLAFFIKAFFVHFFVIQRDLKHGFASSTYSGFYAIVALALNPVKAQPLR